MFRTSRDGLQKKSPLILIVSCGILILNLSLSFTVRTQIAQDLQDKYAMSPDAYRDLRQAKIIDEHGKLPKRDMDRWVPLGVDLTERTTLFPYLIVYLYRFYRLFDSSIMLERFVIYHPAVIYLLSLILYYFLISHSLGKSTALLSATIISIIPVLIRHTMAGETDRDSLSLFLSLSIFYVYYQSTQQRQGKFRIALSVLSGVISAITGLFWEGAGLFVLVIILYNASLLVLERFTRKDFEYYCAWYFPLCLILLAFTKVYHTFSVFSILLIGVPSFFFFIALTHTAINRFGNQETLAKIPLGFSLSFLFLLLLLVGSTFSSQVFRMTWTFFSPLGENEVLRSVAELRPTTSYFWMHNYGIYLAFFCGGGIILMYRLAERLKLNTWLCVAGLQFFLTTVFFSRFLKTSEMSIVSEILYIAASFVFLVLTLGQYLYTKKYIDRKGEFSPLSRRILFFFSWFVVMLVSANTAIRFHLFLAPVLVALGSYAVAELLRFLVQERHHTSIICTVLIILCWEIFALYPLLGFSHVSNKVVFWLSLFISLALIIPIITGMKNIKGSYRFLLVGVIVLVCTLPSSRPVWGYADKAYQMASQLRSGMHGPWLGTVRWIEKHTQKDAVIGAWWDYGSLINYLTERKTIIDEEQLEYWVHLFARHVLLAKTETEALEFLKAHQATHLLISPKEIYNITTISRLASKENLDRAGVIVPLQPRKGKIIDSNIRVLFCSALDVVELNDYIYSDKQIALKGVSLKIRKEEYGRFTPIEIKGFINIGDTEVQVGFTNVYFGNTLIKGFMEIMHLDAAMLELPLIETKDSIKIPGTLFVIPDSSIPPKGNWEVIYCSQSIGESWAVKLYFLNQSSESVKLVYSALWSGPDDPPGFWGIKIWSLKYPDEIQINPKYLSTRPKF